MSEMIIGKIEPLSNKPAPIKLTGSSFFAAENATLKQEIAALRQQEQRMRKALALAYEHLVCADCTPDDYQDCSRHQGLHVQANLAVSKALSEGG